MLQYLLMMFSLKSNFVFLQLVKTATLHLFRDIRNSIVFLWESCYVAANYNTLFCTRSLLQPYLLRMPSLLCPYLLAHLVFFTSFFLPYLIFFTSTFFEWLFFTSTFLARLFLLHLYLLCLPLSSSPLFSSHSSSSWPLPSVHALSSSPLPLGMPRLLHLYLLCTLLHSWICGTINIYFSYLSCIVSCLAKIGADFMNGRS